MNDYKHSEQKEPTGPNQKKYKISYFAYDTSQSPKHIRAYKIIYADNVEHAKQKMDIWPPLVYNISEI